MVKKHEKTEFMVDNQLDAAFDAQPEEGVECLGIHFDTDDQRREHFSVRLKEGLEELHAKLAVPFTTVDDAVRVMQSVEKWPMGDEVRLREIAERVRWDQSDKDLLQRWKDQVGFPHGELDDILRLSDPPYYTSCPNPFLSEFVRIHGRPYDPGEPFSRKPFAVDVSEGKTDPLYKAHGYHTKVPYLAIVPSILHYTEPGDLVLDGFAGTGMTGVAAQFCGRSPRTYRERLEAKWEEQGLGTPKWGARRVVLCDLAPSATLIAANYNIPLDVSAFRVSAQKILDGVEHDWGWMYETLHGDGRTKCRVEYVVWSEVLTCPKCSREIVFLDVAVDMVTGAIKKAFDCPHCDEKLTRRKLQRLYVTQYDAATGSTVQRPKRLPRLIRYAVGRMNQTKQPDSADMDRIDRAGSLALPASVPTEVLPYMHMTHERARLDAAGVTHVHHFYTPRTAQYIGALWANACDWQDARARIALMAWLDSHLVNLSMQNRYRPGVSFPYNPLGGVYYVPSLVSEADPLRAYENKLKRIGKAFEKHRAYTGLACVTTCNAGRLDMPDNTVDYIFTDPPFGENIYYADLNYLTESWLRVRTQASQEAIVDKAKKKQLADYQHLMKGCFIEYCRVLKPGRWMTVVFSSSSNSVWNAIQEAMVAAGFVVADVRALNKQQGSYRQVTSAAVKQDLVISAYKPSGGLDERFRLEAGTEEGIWDFVRAHLRQLPACVEKDNHLDLVVERQRFVLYDRTVAFHVQRGVTLSLSAAEFHAGLVRRFINRDDMFFLPEQAAEYDQKRVEVRGLGQTEV